MRRVKFSQAKRKLPTGRFTLSRGHDYSREGGLAECSSPGLVKTVPAKDAAW